MHERETNPYGALERLFHEPNRLAILSALCGQPDGLAFTDLKTRLDLTDGNLSRHLKTLEEAGVIEIDKTFVDSKPRTTIRLTDGGREHFLDYLKALEEVLRQAEREIKAGAKAGKPFLNVRKMARA